MQKTTTENISAIVYIRSLEECDTIIETLKKLEPLVNLKFTTAGRKKNWKNFFKSKSIGKVVKKAKKIPFGTYTIPLFVAVSAMMLLGPWGFGVAIGIGVGAICLYGLNLLISKVENSNFFRRILERIKTIRKTIKKTFKKKKPRIELTIVILPGMKNNSKTEISKKLNKKFLKPKIPKNSGIALEKPSQNTMDFSDHFHEICSIFDIPKEERTDPIPLAYEGERLLLVDRNTSIGEDDLSSEENFLKWIQTRQEDGKKRYEVIPHDLLHLYKDLWSSAANLLSSHQNGDFAQQLVEKFKKELEEIKRLDKEVLNIIAKAPNKYTETHTEVLFPSFQKRFEELIEKNTEGETYSIQSGNTITTLDLITSIMPSFYVGERSLSKKPGEFSSQLKKISKSLENQKNAESHIKELPVFLSACIKELKELQEINDLKDFLKKIKAYKYNKKHTIGLDEIKESIARSIADTYKSNYDKLRDIKDEVDNKLKIWSKLRNNLFDDKLALSKKAKNFIKCFEKLTALLPQRTDSSLINRINEKKLEKKIKNFNNAYEDLEKELSKLSNKVQNPTENASHELNKKFEQNCSDWEKCKKEYRLSTPSIKATVAKDLELLEKPHIQKPSPAPKTQPQPIIEKSSSGSAPSDRGTSRTTLPSSTFNPINETLDDERIFSRDSNHLLNKQKKLKSIKRPVHYVLKKINKKTRGKISFLMKIDKLLINKNKKDVYRMIK